MGRTLTMDEAKARPLEELLREVAERGETLRIEMQEGEAVEVRPAQPGGKELSPLETLPGYVPEGWKDAIYGPRG